MTPPDTTAPAPRPPYRAALAAFAAALLVFIATLAPTVTFWDAGEFIAAAKVVGIPHPPATPLFVLLGHVWATLVPVGEYAWRTNLMSAVFSAAGTGFFFLVAHESLAAHREPHEPAGWWPVAGGFAAALLGAFTFTNWQNSNETEVYAVATCGIAAVAWLALVWRRRRAEPSAGKWLLLIVAIFGLAVGTHLLALLAGPAVLAGLVSTLIRAPAPDRARRRAEWGEVAVVGATWVLLVATGLGNTALMAVGAALVVAGAIYAAGGGRLGFALLALAVAAFGTTPYLFVYLRAAQSPALNMADPDTLTSLFAVIGRQQYGIRTPFDDPTVYHGPENPGRSPLLIFLQVVNYFQYFDWQWAKGVEAKLGPLPLRTLATLAMASLGLHGLRVQRARHRDAWWLLVTLFAVTGLGLVAYMNFRPGFSLGYQWWPRGADHEVRERDYFFVVSYVVWGLWAGIGAAELLGRVRARGLAVAGLAALVLVPLTLNWSAATRRNPTDERLAADTGYNFLNSVPPYGILFTYGDNDTYPLWWAQEVAGIRRDVTVVCLALANTDWYMRQLRDRAPGPFEPAQAPELWRAAVATPPTRPLHSMTDDEIASAASAARLLDQPLTVNLGPFSHTIPANTVMQPADILALRIIQENIGRRPIAWAITTGSPFLGLGDYMVQQGLAFRLEAAAPNLADPNISRMRLAGTALDVGLTEQLAWKTYRYAGLEAGDPTRLETTSAGFAGSYTIPFTQLAAAYAARGDSVQALKNFERAARLSPDLSFRKAFEAAVGRR